MKPSFDQRNANSEDWGKNPKNNSERPVDALAVKKVTHWLTTWNQEMLAYLKMLVQPSVYEYIEGVFLAGSAQKVPVSKYILILL